MELYANDKRVNILYQLRSTTGTPIKFRACEKNSTLLSMSDNYVHCTMLFELILSLLLQSKAVAALRQVLAGPMPCH